MLEPAIAATIARSRKFGVTRAAYRAAGFADRPAVLNHLVAENARFTARYYAGIPRLLATGCRRRLQRSFDVPGADELLAAAGEGRGVILVAAHVGEFDLAGSWLAEVAGLPPVVCVGGVPSRARRALYDGLRTACGFTLRRQGELGFQSLLTDLRSGRLVITMFDRPGRSEGVSVQFLGRAARVARGPYALAEATGAPLVSAVTYRSGSGRVLALGTPLRAGAGRREAVMQLLAEEIGASVRKAPSQWHVPAHPHQLPWQADDWYVTDPVG